MSSNLFTERAQSRNPEKAENPGANIFAQRAQEKEQPKEEEEGLAKSLARYGFQVPFGLAEGTVYGIASNLFNLISTGAALDPNEIESLRYAAERSGIPFDEEAYTNAAKEISQNIPTPSNIARMGEEKTGLPLTPKTKGQKALNYASAIGKLVPKQGNVGGVPFERSVPTRAGIGTAAAGGKTELENVGVPEGISDLLAPLLLRPVGIGQGPRNINPTIGLKEKPSGMKERLFENVKKPREVSAEKKGQISQKVESDFKKISDEIVGESPIAETKKGMQENPKFKKDVEESFQQVTKLAESIPETLNTNDLKKTLVNSSLKKKGVGFAPGEYDKDYRKFLMDFLNETPTQEISAADLVHQYRKNNKELQGAFDPSKSRNYNNAKKDALLDINRAIGQTIDERFPNSEFSNLFKETNKQWSQIRDTETINSFVDNLFEGGIQFQKGKKLFDNPKLQNIFKRGLGQEGYQKFETLMNDLLKTETPYKMLKEGQKKGYFRQIAEHGIAYALSPHLLTAKVGYESAVKTYKALMNSILDKPKIAIKWEGAVKNLNKGNFAEAEKGFEALNREIEILAPEVVPKSAKKKETIEGKAERVKPKQIEKK